MEDETAAIAMAIKPQYADALFDKRKQYEIRRVKPRRTPGVVFVYETAPTRAFRGALLVSAVEHVESESLRERIGPAEFAIAGPYLAHKSGGFWLYRIRDAIRFESLAWDATLHSHFGRLQSFTYVGLADPADVELLWHYLSGTASTEYPILSRYPLDRQVESALDDRLVADVGRYYGELVRGFQETHVPPVGASSPSVGFSSIGKVAFAIRDGRVTVGKIVLTLKRGNALKIGPVFVEPQWRNRGYATAAVRRVVDRARELGIVSVYSTVPRPNLAAQRVFDKANFSLSDSLVSHYREEIDEDIRVTATRRLPNRCWRDVEASRRQLTMFVNEDCSAQAPEVLIEKYVNSYFFAVDDNWRRWLVQRSSDFERFRDKPHEIVSGPNGSCALVIFKRGGTAKVVPVAPGLNRIPYDLIQACEKIARDGGRRKVSLFLPEANLPWLNAALPPGYVLEATPANYSIYFPIRIYSRHLYPGSP